MPVGDGFSVLRHVKDQFDAMRGAVLTGDASASVRERCDRLRADAVIDKADASVEVLPALRVFR